MRKKKSSPQLVTDLRPAANQPSLFSKSKKFIAKKWGIFLLIIAVVLIAVLTFGYINTRNELNRLSNPQEASKNATQELVGKVGELILLPEGETPTTANVSDVSKLKKQEFFARAQNGDKVLIYSESGRAVLYRPSTNKVVEYSKVNLNNAD